MKRWMAMIMLVVLCVTGYIVPAAAEEWACSACSTANDGNFCTECGAAKPKPTPTPAPKKCLNCGFTVEPESPYKFCPTCGLKFGEAPATPTPAPTATPKPTPTPTPKKTPTPTPKKTPTPTPRRVFEITGVSRSATDGTVTVKWTDSADRGPYKVTYRQHVSDDFNSSRQKKIWYYTAAESTYLNSCTILYMEPSANYWFTVEDRDGNEVRYAFKPQKFLTFESFNVGFQLQPKQRKTGDGTNISRFSRDDIKRKTLYDFGAYIKLTFPRRGSTQTFVAFFVVTDPNGIQQCVYRHETLTLKKGTSSLYWNFYDFDQAFENAEKYDGIATGEWRVDLYFNNRYVTCAKFNVGY